MSESSEGSIPHGVFDPPRRARRLRVYVGESDKVGGRPLYEALVLRARELHLAGATVLRSPMGFGASSRLHTTKVLRLSQDLPFVVEIIDTPERIALILPFVHDHVGGGLVTIEDVEVLQYHPSS
jgi:PII-like signaling protein